jgi:MarR family transcriptional regulator, transcriptional regulator for hemolysin
MGRNMHLSAKLLLWLIVSIAYYCSLKAETKLSNPEQPENPDLEGNFGFLISDIARLLREQFNDTARILNLTLAQARVIMHLARNEGTSQVALARLLEVQPITLLRQLDYLEEMAFINRRANPNDRRAQQLYLTDTGRDLVDTIWALSESIRVDALVHIDADTQKSLIRSLEQIKQNLVTAGDKDQPEDGSKGVSNV